jgi:hypothetical protein
MGLSDIITTPFLLCLGICFLLIVLLGFYFMQKINEQNHKMNSMLDLITTVANELNHVNGRLHTVQMVGEPKVIPNLQTYENSNNMLIPISDDEEDMDIESECELNEDEEDEEDEEEEDEEEDEHEHEDENENEDNKDKSFIKSINIGNVLNFNFDDTNLNEEVVQDLLGDESDLDSVITSSEKEDNLQSDEDDFESEEDEPAEDKPPALKSVQLSDLEEIKQSVKIDYKKFALNKLRSMVVDKGLSSDTSKLKKQDLIKLLEEN